jgi:hypothetical protein
MAQAPVFFHRPELAQRLAQQILIVGAGSASSSGIFLAAPRRTGKSTFIREDLRPAFEAEGAIVVYADLWANPGADPGDIIVHAIRTTLATTDGALFRLAKSLALSKISIGGAMNFDLDRVGMGSDVSLTEALVALSDEARKMIVLVIDEAQHAITTYPGMLALHALKAARDELNSSQHHGLRVVCTGSNRDKLAMLRNGKDQAFFGAPLVNFPLLNRPFADWFCRESRLPFLLDPERVWPLFMECGYRPELLAAAADAFRFDFEMDTRVGPDNFEEEVRRLKQEMNEVQGAVIHRLPPLQG